MSYCNLLYPHSLLRGPQSSYIVLVLILRQSYLRQKVCSVRIRLFSMRFGYRSLYHFSDCSCQGNRLIDIYFTNEACDSFNYRRFCWITDQNTFERNISMKIENRAPNNRYKVYTGYIVLSKLRNVIVLLKSYDIISYFI